VTYEYGDEAAADRFETGLWPAHDDSPLPIFSTSPAYRHIEPRPTPSAFAEIDCLRTVLPGGLIAWAERRAVRIGVGADRVLVTADAMTEDAYIAALAASLGVRYERLDRISRDACPLDDKQLIRAAITGLLPLYHRGELLWIVAPRDLLARRLANADSPLPHWMRRFHLTSSARLWRFVSAHTQAALGWQATDSLRASRPLLSNAPRATRQPNRIALAALALAAALLITFPAGTFTACGAILCLVFLAAAVLRISSVWATGDAPTRSTRLPEDQLPIYTIICALYHEATVIEDLVASVRALDYPSEKLDVKFVIEPDDDETRRALAALDLGYPFEVHTAPAAGPRTKPKALNAVLPFARGPFTAVYDAEDRPEPNQLRQAYEAFSAGGQNLGCVQARLTIDNTADGWLARMFTAEYAGHFDAFLPGLASLGLPIPLGGSSNHFRTAVLRRIGAWDPFNVTEDADLGIRLCRFGYRTAVIASSTYEEAPAHIKPWLKQRTRWFKGWMQTWLVHTRRPRRLVRELGSAGALTVQLVIGANVLAALAHPFVLAGVAYWLLTRRGLSGTAGISADALLFAATCASGYIASIVPSVIGLSRRHLLRSAWVLALVPVHWLLLSFAAWRALYQLIRDPHRWEKTDHGLAKSSRMADGGADSHHI
jgi:cellulose synthase/poly-beta-1,6-N-acetylglucosamine synthase-like glycosyltransferase